MRNAWINASRFEYGGIGPAVAGLNTGTGCVHQDRKTHPPSAAPVSAQHDARMRLALRSATEPSGWQLRLAGTPRAFTGPFHIVSAAGRHRTPTGHCRGRLA